MKHASPITCGALMINGSGRQSLRLWGQRSWEDPRSVVSPTTWPLGHSEHTRVVTMSRRVRLGTLPCALRLPQHVVETSYGAHFLMGSKVCSASTFYMLHSIFSCRASKNPPIARKPTACQLFNFIYVHSMSLTCSFTSQHLL